MRSNFLLLTNKNIILKAKVFGQTLQNNLENEIFKNTCFSSDVRFRHCYVDDALCLFTGNQHDLTNFLAFKNSLHCFINFTYEIEVNDQIL